MPVFYALLIAHLVADFLQPAALVRWTIRGTGGLVVHVTTYALLTMVVILGYGPVWFGYLVLLSAFHFGLDRIKHLWSLKHSRGSVYVFLLDQATHIGVIYLVALALAGTPLSPFMRLVSPYSHFLPLVAGYIGGTFAVSILVFEAGLTFAPKKTDDRSEQVVTSEGRVVGIVERAVAITVILAHFYALVPFAFSVSIYRLARAWKTDGRRRQIVELATSLPAAVAIAVLMLS